MIKSINPATEKVIAEYEPYSEEAVDNRLQMAQVAHQSWRGTTFADRSERLNRLADVLESRKDSAAQLMTAEMGKPITQAYAEVEKSAWVCRFYAEHGEEFLTSRTISTDAEKSYVRYDPLGVVLAVMPWNFPFWQVFRFAAPAVMAGNAGLLKHASNVSGCALMIEELFTAADFPAGLFSTLLLPAERAEQLIDRPIIRAVTLTGSERAGRAIGKRAGANLKKTVQELGGSDPFVVLADADIGAAVEAAVTARTLNSGQSCIAAKRFILEQSIATEFTDAFVEKLMSLQMGDPAEEATEIGPLARQDLREDLHSQVAKSVETGAQLLCGGELPAGPGFFYPPTVLTDVTSGMAAFDEETFGPVAALTVASQEDEAIQFANQTRFGLGASLWTSDLEKGHSLAAKIDAGAVFVNSFTKSDPRLPFGGIKDSGYGRELSSEGIREFVNVKTVSVG
ncbi:MAG: NAD-dependent succinate-semialdehyde dehydrogenase [Planctomycetaceae bacterium]|nr:NAD-dependent succinate-semialdehyde dehydrogenase [Planctomycetaceae bacterium]